MNRCQTNSELASQRAVRDALRVAADVRDLLSGQASAIVGLASDSVFDTKDLARVLIVARVRGPFEVLRVVVGAVTVEMVHRVFARTGTQESFGYECVQKAVALPCTKGQTSRWVAVATTGATSRDLDKVSRGAISTRPVRSWHEPAQATEAADFVDPLPAADRAPLFIAITLMLHYVDLVSRGVAPWAVSSAPGLPYSTKSVVSAVY